MKIAEEFKEAVKYALENPPLRMIESGSLRGQKALKAYLKMRPGIIDDKLEKYQGYTLLHVAARRGNAGAVKILAEYGADLKQTTDSGVTPLALAVIFSDNTATWSERQRLASYLLEKGADIEARFGYDQRTMLQEAFAQNMEKEARFLLSKGANAHAEPLNEKKMTPLMECLLVPGGENMLELGIAEGMDVTAENIYGMTPMCFARTAAAALTLIEAGADPYHKDVSGCTAIAYVPEQEREIVESRLQADAGRLSALREQKKAKQDAAHDAACHAPVNADTMKPLKLKKKPGPRA